MPQVADAPSPCRPLPCRPLLSQGKQLEENANAALAFWWEPLQRQASAAAPTCCRALAFLQAGWGPAWFCCLLLDWPIRLHV